MTGNLAGTYDVRVTHPTGTLDFGTFTVDENQQISGEGLRRITYRGAWHPTPGGGANVRVTATIPAGTPVDEELKTLEESQRDLEFHLDQEHLAGAKAKSVWLYGFGTSDLFFHRRR
ncbi:hypothetical protein ACIP29_13240 [Streptomyces coelicoflavus]|uniref:hypothetical protein n=1 Tax=Streptomyces coelicoflavus TaxID=285562 RepID=UPI00382DC683